MTGVCLRHDRDDDFLDTIIDKFLQEIPVVVTELEQEPENHNVLLLALIVNKYYYLQILIFSIYLLVGKEKIENDTTYKHA